MYVAEVESAILQSFSEALGSHNASRMQQLLLFHAASDVLPTSSSIGQPPIHAGSPRRKQGGPRKRMSEVFEFDTDRGGDGSEFAQTTNSSVVSGELAPGHIGSPAVVAANSSPRSASMSFFPHIPMAIDVMQSIRDKIAEVSRDRDRLLSLNQSSVVAAIPPLCIHSPYQNRLLIQSLTKSITSFDMNCSTLVFCCSAILLITYMICRPIHRSIFGMRVCRCFRTLETP